MEKQLIVSDLSLIAVLDLCPNCGDDRDDEDCKEDCLTHWVRQDKWDTTMELFSICKIVC